MGIKMIRRTLIALVVMLAATLWAGQLHAESATDLSATIPSNDPTKPVLHLQNISGSTCQVATTAQGTVSVTKVVQAGKTIQPLANDSASDEDIGYLLKSQLKALQPGQTADLPLQVYKLHSGYVLRATTWSADGGMFTSDYPLASGGALQLDLNYSLPITPSAGARACGAVFASTTNGLPLDFMLKIGAAVLGLAALVLLVWLLWRHGRRRHKAIAAAVFVLLGLGAWLWHAPQPAHADVVVPPEIQSTYDGCMGVFNANSDLTQSVLDMLNNPANHFEIVHTTTAGSDMTGRRNPGGGGDFTIYWNPNDHHQYAGTGGYPEPCSVLFHELYHALEMSQGTFSRDECDDSGLETKEVTATRAENALRGRLGLPARSHYGDTPLPSGSCNTPSNPHACTGNYCGETNGDPHLRTIDGFRYDFQAAGEFVSARDPSGGFEIQARQQPWANSRLVSINTALAFNVAGDRVELQAEQPMRLLVNGKTQALADVKLAHGGQLTSSNDGVVTLTWPDGSLAYARPVGSYGLALDIQPTEERAKKLEGLLAPAVGNAKNELRVQGSNKTIQPVYDQLYPAFANSWRITDKASLFTYDKGKNTASYTIQNFPDKPGNSKDLPGYAAAELYCKNSGISDPTTLANCALDMAITGRPEFARAAVNSQAFIAGAHFAGTTWQLHIVNPGDSASVTFDARAHEKVFVQVLQTTLPSQCGTLTITAPDGSEAASGCYINGSGEIDTTALPVDGTYTLHLAPNGPTGDAAVRLLRITDKQGTITPDGSTVTANIDQPGMVARYTFTAHAGQRVYVDIPSSTIASECGLFTIQTIDGQVISSGCVINHAGYIDTTTLRADGQYMVVVDPSESVTGQANLHLILATNETKSITMNGPSVSVNLKKPGSTATFTFGGSAGQKVFVDVTHSDLPSQCGLLALHAPNGDGLASGCVINHTGNLSDTAITLPTDGTYTLTFDPGASDAGTTTLRLRDH